MNKRILVIGIVSTLCMTLPLAAEDGLVAHWRFDKAGPAIADLSGSGHVAQVTGAKVVTDDGKPVLALDGRQRIVVPSSPGLNLAKGFSIEMRLRLGEVAAGRTFLFKDGQYSIRFDWLSEGSKLSFFVCAGERWEPRTSAPPPEPGAWCHLVATWSGADSFLWVDGEPHHVARRGDPPPASESPLVIASDSPHGQGIVGRLDYVKLYRRVLTPAEIIARAYGITPAAGAEGQAPQFDFHAGLQGWAAVKGASATIRDGRLVFSSPSPRGMLLHKALGAGVDKRDYLSLRMAVDSGSRGEVIFVTTRGAGRIPFQTIADGRPHTYVLEPWTWAGWGGRLLALGLVPAEVAGAKAQIDHLRVTEELRAEPELEVSRVFSDSTLPRAERAEKIVARVLNRGGPAAALQATLSAPEGVSIRGPLAQSVPALKFSEKTELRWSVEAARPLAGPFRVTVSGAGTGEVSASQGIAFASGLRPSKASYVPKPVPAKPGKYRVWTHYCPLWKHGTHYGWKVIEPWPERKPVLGWFNEGEPEVADWHIKYMLEHGITGIVYCWYRTNLNGPVTQQLGHAIHDGLLKARYLPMIQFAVMWENGCGQGCGSAEDLLENVLPFWIENYFSNPSYLRIDGKPVLYIWVPTNVTKHLGGSEKVRKTFDRMRAICRDKGLGGLFIVGCVGWHDSETLKTMAREGWDASSAYGSGWQQPAAVRTVGDFVCAPYEGFVEQQEGVWKLKRQLGALPDITAAMMGWDSRPWKETPFFWSDNTPEKFRDLCLRAKAIMDSCPTAGPEKNTVIFCCWNEFGEGHYIEPTRGNGFSYLDAIRDVFTEGPKEHLDVAPQDVGLGPYDSWYRKFKESAGTEGSSTASSWSGEDLSAWAAMMGLEKVEVRDGVLRAVSTGPDPAFRSPELKVRASRYNKLVVEMRVSRPGSAQLFWSTATMPQTSEAASVSVGTRGDGQFHAYEFAVGRNDHWGGCVTGLRLDPAVAAGVAIEIRSIRME